MLESGGEGDAPRGTVFVRLLGPFAGRAGEPLTLCWRLERGGAPPSAVRTRPLATAPPAPPPPPAGSRGARNPAARLPARRLRAYRLWSPACGGARRT